MKGKLMKKVFLSVLVFVLLTSIGLVTAQDDKPITIWIDTTRQAAVDAFVKANPDKASLIKTEIVDRAEFAQKVLTLFTHIITHKSGCPFRNQPYGVSACMCINAPERLIHSPFC